MTTNRLKTNYSFFLRPNFCAKEFIFKKIPNARLNAISDIESIRNKWIEDNTWT